MTDKDIMIHVKIPQSLLEDPSFDLVGWYIEFLSLQDIHEYKNQLLFPVHRCPNNHLPAECGLAATVHDLKPAHFHPEEDDEGGDDLPDLILLSDSEDEDDDEDEEEEDDLLDLILLSNSEDEDNEEDEEEDDDLPGLIPLSDDDDDMEDQSDDESEEDDQGDFFDSSSWSRNECNRVVILELSVFSRKEPFNVWEDALAARVAEVLT